MNTIAHTIRRRPARENVARLGAELQCGFARNAPGNEPNHTDILDGWYGLVYVLQGSGYLTDARGNRHARVRHAAGSVTSARPGRARTAQLL